MDPAAGCSASFGRGGSLGFYSAEEGSVGPTANFRATEVYGVRTEQVGVGFEDAEQFRFRSRALGEPPAVLSIRHTWIDRSREVRAKTDSSLRRDHPGPRALLEP